MADLVCVRTFPNRPAAELARAALEGAGIRAVVQADDAGGFDLTYGAGARLLVTQEDARRAAEVLPAE